MVKKGDKINVPIFEMFLKMHLLPPLLLYSCYLDRRRSVRPKEGLSSHRRLST